MCIVKVICYHNLTSQESRTAQQLIRKKWPPTNSSAWWWDEYPPPPPLHSTCLYSWLLPSLCQFWHQQQMTSKLLPMSFHPCITLPTTQQRWWSVGSAKKVHLGFSSPSYRKMWTNFWANPISCTSLFACVPAPWVPLYGFLMAWKAATVKCAILLLTSLPALCLKEPSIFLDGHLIHCFYHYLIF